MKNCWATGVRRFAFYEGGEEVVTYSIPLVDQRGRAVGVFGVEISLNYLYKYLPPSDLLAVDSYGYVIGIRSERTTDPSACHTRCSSETYPAG